MTDQTFDLDAWLDHLRSIATEVDPIVSSIVAAGPTRRFSKDDAWTADPWIVGTGRLLDALDIATAELRKLRDYVAAEFARKVPFQTSLISIPGLPAMEPRWGGTRKAWKNDLLQADLRPRLLVNEDGEMLQGEALLDRVFQVVSLIGSNVKTSGLRALGLDPNDYSTQEPKDPTVQIVRSS